MGELLYGLQSDGTPTPLEVDSLGKIVLSPPTSFPTQDDGPSTQSSWGVADAPVTSADMSGAAVDVTDAPTSGEHLVIDDILVSSDTAMQFTFTEETSGAVVGHARVPANGTAQVTFRGRRRLATADKKLRCQTDVAGNVEVLIGYHSED